MPHLKIAVIGAGSSYTPELIEKLAELRYRLPVKEIALTDIDGQRLEIMASFCRRFADHLDYDVAVTHTTNRDEAIEGADFIDTQIRVGGNAARANDERIPLKYGLIGQETTGAGGFISAMRTIPVMLDIVRDVERLSPNAWIINYTNPTGLVTEAVTGYSKTGIAGLCSGGLFPRIWAAADGVSLDPSTVRYNYIGLNHMNFAYNITTNGRPLSSEEWDRMAEAVPHLDSNLVKKLRLIPSPYLQYYFHAQKQVSAAKGKELTRGEEVQVIERELFREYADPGQVTKPDLLSKRGGGGYSEVAIGVMDAIYNDTSQWMVVNVPNNGAIRFLPDNAVIETGCTVNRSGIHPLAVEEVPKAVWGLICAVKNYEQLTVEAAVTGDRDTALLALIAHPLIMDYDIAEPLLTELLEVNQAYLPQFFGPQVGDE